MPSGLLSPFLALDDDALSKTFLSLSVNEAKRSEAKSPPGFQRTVSACTSVLSSSGISGPEHLEDVGTPQDAADGSDPTWPLRGMQWNRNSELPRTSLQHIPFRVDRSVSLIEGCRGEVKAVSSRYKTELCRTFEESGACKYGAKCQFAHGAGELRGLSRHPKYKTEPCRTFHTSGICPYGARCHFIHNAEERRLLPPQAPLLRHSLSSGSCVAEPLPCASPPLSGSHSLQLPETFLPCDSLSQPPLGCSRCTLSTSKTGPFPFPGLLMIQKSLSADSLSDQEDSGSSGGSSGSESPGLASLGRRLPIFSRLSISDD